ncbi:MAG: PEP-CTERM sorting domain-containing protein [Calothrix sp. C42_A2020_038]|nr:PEP-CTERM sorting domain-containing protein [Calothrix sp. C42_A2020_038]
MATSVNTTSKFTTTNNMTANIGDTDNQENRDYFQADDVVDWQASGKACTSLPTTFLTSSRQGISVQVSIASGSLLRIDQTSVDASGFEMGEALLSTGHGNPGPMTIVFEHPIYGVNIKVQPDTTDDSEYTVSIEGFDRLDTSIKKIKLPGISQKGGSGATCLNLLDSKGRIKKLVLSAKEQGIHIPFVINTIKLKTA